MMNKQMHDYDWDSKIIQKRKNKEFIYICILIIIAILYIFFYFFINKQSSAINSLDEFLKGFYFEFIGFIFNVIVLKFVYERLNKTRQRNLSQVIYYELNEIYNCYLDLIKMQYKILKKYGSFDLNLSHANILDFSELSRFDIIRFIEPHEDFNKIPFKALIYDYKIDLYYKIITFERKFIYDKSDESDLRILKSLLFIKNGYCKNQVLLNSTIEYQIQNQQYIPNNNEIVSIQHIGEYLKDLFANYYEFGFQIPREITQLKNEL